jgi:two-component system nitrogen regulation sensor histidine kinase NtrY
MKPTDVIDKADTGDRSAELVTPEASDFEDARKTNAVPRADGRPHLRRRLQPLPAFPDMFLYTARPVDPFTIEFARDANNLIALYSAFDSHRRNIQIAFATMYVAIAAIVLLSAVYLGLSFANRLVQPIRRLIGAADQVAAGDLAVEVHIRKSEGDLANLGDTFNKMTSELRQQREDLINARDQIDSRRRFTEAVLAGVTAGVIGSTRPAG